MQPGFHLVHKPVGATSFSLVRDAMDEVAAQGLRKQQMPVCHGGALDPFAEGLVVLLAGQATRLLELLHPISKTYVADIAWGTETDNGDPLGAPTATATDGQLAHLTPAALDAALAGFLGWQEQVPPRHSNKRVDGERAYLKAHRGEDFVLPPSRVFLQEARFLTHDLPRRSQVQLVARGGYYVRALARDLGRAVGCPAHLGALRRVAIGPWQDPGPGRAGHVHGRGLVPWCPARELSAAEEAELRGGRPIPLGAVAGPDWALPAGFPAPDAPIRALRDGRLVALVREKAGQLWTFANLRGGL